MDNSLLLKGKSPLVSIHGLVYLFDDDYDPTDERSKQLMQAIDELNQLYGRGMMRFASMGTNQRWQTRAQYRSNRWTTRWQEIPIVKC